MRRVFTVPFAAGVLGLAACGSASRVAAPPPPPRLPRAVAVALAHRSDVLAEKLRGGNACAARIQAHGLERETRLAIAGGRVPARYRPVLLAAERLIVQRMPLCVPPSPPPLPPPPPAPHPKHPNPRKPPKHHKHGRHGKGADEG